MIPGAEFPQQKNSSNHYDVFRFCLFEETEIHQSVTGSFCILASQVGNSQLCATPLPPQPVTNNANTRTITINIVL